LFKISVNSGSNFWPTHLQTVGLPVPNGNFRDFTLFYAEEKRRIFPALDALRRLMP
jgi:hypothetical protein